MRRHAAFLLVVFALGCGDGDPPAAGAGDGSAGDGGALDGAALDGDRPDSDPPDRAPLDLGPPLDAAADAAPTDAAPTDAAPVDAGAPTLSPPARILFIGNSFTFGGPVPTIVDLLANGAGWPDPEVVYSAFGGESLQGHRTSRPQTLERVDAGGWDVVVLQELSTRPTDNIGDPERFKADATWFFDRIKASSPTARVLLYETWARHPDHGIYPGSFANPTEMQAQLRFHYRDAAERYLPEHAESPVAPPVVVAPAGDGWEAHLAEPDALRLHGDDDYHAGLAGQYLNALVIYSTIYERAVAGLDPWRLADADAARLQRTVDRLTGRRTLGGPAGMPATRGLRVGQVVRVDVGDDDVDQGWPERWNGFDGPVAGAALGLRDGGGEATSVDLRVTRPFGGINREGLVDNDLDLPGGASHDTFFCGSFDDHADGLTRPGRLRIDGLDPAGRYRLLLYASRTGTDGDRGRLTRYSVTGDPDAGPSTADLEVADNRGGLAELAFTPDGLGGADLEVGVSPAGRGRFCYLGALVVERLAP